MLSQRAVSGVKLLGIGSLGLFSSAILFLGMFIALLMWAPWWLALKVFDVPTLDVFRIFYASSYTILAPALLFGGATGFTLSTIIAKKSKASKRSIFYVMLSVVFVGLFVAGAFVPSVTAISATQTAEYNQFNNKPCTFYIFTDGTNYYAQDCTLGSITYGGPGNAGGATGTNASSVIQTAVNQIGTNTAPGQIVMATGTYPLTHGGVTRSSNVNLTLQWLAGASWTYTGTYYALNFSSKTGGAFNHINLINPNIYAGSGSCISFMSAQWVSITPGVLSCKTIGIELDNANEITITGGYIKEVGNVRGAGTIGIRLDSNSHANNIIISPFEINGFGVGLQSGTSAYAGNAQGNQVTGTYFTSNTTGILIYIANDFTIGPSNYFEVDTSADIQVTNTGTNPPGQLNIIHNYFASTPTNGALYIPNGNNLNVLYAVGNAWGSEAITIGSVVTGGYVQTYSAGTVTNNGVNVATNAQGIGLVMASTLQKAETGADSTLLVWSPTNNFQNHAHLVCIALSVAGGANGVTGFGWKVDYTDANNKRVTSQEPLSENGTAAPALTYSLTTTSGQPRDFSGCWSFDQTSTGVNIVVETTVSGGTISYKASAWVFEGA